MVKAVTPSIVLLWELGIGAKDLPNYWAKDGTTCVVRLIVKKLNHEAVLPPRRTPVRCCYCFLCVWKFPPLEGNHWGFPLPCFASFSQREHMSEHLQRARYGCGWELQRWFAILLLQELLTIKQLP